MGRNTFLERQRCGMQVSDYFNLENFQFVVAYFKSCMNIISNVIYCYVVNG